MVRNLSVNVGKKIKMNKSVVHLLIKAVKKELLFTVNYLEINFVDNSYIHELNIEYLGHDYTTDIITFNYSGENHNLDGEIFISIDEAKINARKYKVKLNDELLRLVIHGILHLIGYDDIKSSDKRVMKRQENNLVVKYKNLFKKLKVQYDR